MVRDVWEGRVRTDRVESSGKEGSRDRSGGGRGNVLSLSKDDEIVEIGGRNEGD